MWNEQDSSGRHTVNAWPIALRKTAMLLAAIKRISEDEAARLIWIEGTEVLGFPVGWSMSGGDIELVKHRIGNLIEVVQRKHTTLLEGK